jgi:hypothetical protein
MHIPFWLVLGLGIIVLLWGAYRVRIGFRTDAEDERAKARKGLYAMARRTHVLLGLVYVLLGGALIATSFGWNPMGNMFGPDTETAPKGKEPTSTGIPVDPIPAPAKK